jgi:hypothetical protein
VYETTDAAAVHVQGLGEALLAELFQFQKASD